MPAIAATSTTAPLRQPYPSGAIGGPQKVYAVAPGNTSRFAES